MTKQLIIVALLLVIVACNQMLGEQGIYFSKKTYAPHPLPTFEKTKDILPSPIYDEDPVYLQYYWKTWELTFKNFYEPTPKSGYVSQFADAAVPIS